MSTKQKLVRRWFKTIRQVLDELEQFIKQEEKPSEADLQLEYFMKRIDNLADRYHSISSKPGRNKSYAFEVEHGCQVFRDIKHDLRIWQIHNVRPEGFALGKDK